MKTLRLQAAAPQLLKTLSFVKQEYSKYPVTTELPLLTLYSLCQTAGEQLTNRTVSFIHSLRIRRIDSLLSPPSEDSTSCLKTNPPVSEHLVSDT